jgi:hypothetical protein
MTAATFSHRAAAPRRGGYGFRTVARMEWQKFRTVRSTWYIVAALAVSMIGLAKLVLSHENYAQLSPAGRASFDPTHDSFISLVLVQLLTGILGVLAFIRHTVGAICAVVGVLFVLPLLAAPLSPSILNTVQNFLPHVMANSMTAAKPVAHMWPPWLSFALLCGYAVAALAAGSWALTSRDA